MCLFLVKILARFSTTFFSFLFGARCMLPRKSSGSNLTASMYVYANEQVAHFPVVNNLSFCPLRLIESRPLQHTNMELIGLPDGDLVTNPQTGMWCQFNQLSPVWSKRLLLFLNSFSCFGAQMCEFEYINHVIPLKGTVRRIALRTESKGRGGKYY